MAIGTISNGDSGASARAKINAGLQAIDATLKDTVSTVSPTATDDTSKGYAVGSSWFNSTLGAEFICSSAATGAAVWVRQDSTDFFGYVSGSYYQGVNATLAGGAAIGGNSIKLHAIIIKERMNLTELGARVTTGETGKSFQLAIYAADPASKLPVGNPLGVTASLSAGGTGVMSAALTNGGVMLNPGLYWLALNSDSTTSIFQTFGSGYTFISSILGGTAAQVSAGNVTSIAYLSLAQAFGTWPDLTGQTLARGINVAYASIFFRAG